MTWNPAVSPHQNQPEVARDKLEALLNANGIAYSYSKASKFANFIKKSLL